MNEITKKETVKIPVKLLGEIKLGSIGHYAPIKVLINDKEYSGSIDYGNVRLTGFDVESVKALGLELDFSEVMTAYNKVVEVNEEAKFQLAQKKRAEEWEERNKLAQSIKFKLRDTKADYVKAGHGWGLNMTYSEVYKGKTITLDVDKGYYSYAILSNNVFGYESASKSKKFKSFRKLPEYVEEMLNACRGAIDYDIRRKEEEKTELSKVQDILGKDVKEEIEEHYVRRDGRCPARFYKTRHYSMTFVSVKGNRKQERAVRFTPIILEGGTETWNVRGLSGEYTTDELKAIFKVVKG